MHPSLQWSHSQSQKRSLFDLSCTLVHLSQFCICLGCSGWVGLKMARLASASTMPMSGVPAVSVLAPVGQPLDHAILLWARGGGALATPLQHSPSLKLFPLCQAPNSWAFLSSKMSPRPTTLWSRPLQACWQFTAYWRDAELLHRKRPSDWPSHLKA